jgi:hypothetical protein
METLALSASVRVLDELMRQGYTVGVKTRVDVYEHKVGPHPVTYAHKLVVRPAGLPDELREAVREHRDELLAAACVIRPPVPWLAVLVDRYLEGEPPWRCSPPTWRASAGCTRPTTGPGLSG